MKDGRNKAFLSLRLQISLSHMMESHGTLLYTLYICLLSYQGFCHDFTEREQVGFRTLHGYKPLPHVLEYIPLETVQGCCTDESMGRISKDLA